MRVLRSRPSVPLFSLLLTLLVGGSCGQGNIRDIVFPRVDDLAVGDPCTIAASPLGDVPFARDGFCRRVRDCPTFVPRVILEPFDIRRDVCYFEVHDPVVCCVQLPVPDSELDFEILRKRLSAQDVDLDNSNLIQ